MRKFDEKISAQFDNELKNNEYLSYENAKLSSDLLKNHENNLYFKFYLISKVLKQMKSRIINQYLYH